MAKLALIPQRTFNAYNTGREEGQYHDGDLVIHFHGCDEVPSNKRDCEKEMEPMFLRWKKRYGDQNTDT